MGLIADDTTEAYQTGQKDQSNLHGAAGKTNLLLSSIRRIGEPLCTSDASIAEGPTGQNDQ